MKFLRSILFLLVLSLFGCAGQQTKETPQVNVPKTNAHAACSCPITVEPPSILIPDEQKTVVPAKPDVVKIPDYSLLKPGNWDEIEFLTLDDPSQAWRGWIIGCTSLINKPAWQGVCEAASRLDPNPTAEAVRAYFLDNFNLYRTSNTDNSDVGLITGYYEPMLKGSRTKTSTYRYPLYSKPEDLVTVDLSSIYPELANKRVRGRLVTDTTIGSKLIPYFNRGEIDGEQSPLRGKELLWLDDLVDAFFLQIQGSGLVQLDSGEQVHVGYADQNGQAYQSIGRVLIERGELTADKASMQGIKNWGKNNLGKLRDLLNSNPSYVFFRELPPDLPGPLGALGVPILAERAVAIDPRYVPLGAPVFLATTYPNSSKPLNRLMMAQDTGGAIKGGVRADFFWGSTAEAAKNAGSMKQKGKIWVLLPKDFVFPK